MHILAIDLQLFAQPRPRHGDAVEALVRNGGNVLGAHVQPEEGAQFPLVGRQRREALLQGLVEGGMDPREMRLELLPVMFITARLKVMHDVLYDLLVLLPEGGLRLEEPLHDVRDQLIFLQQEQGIGGELAFLELQVLLQDHLLGLQFFALQPERFLLQRAGTHP